MKINQQHYRTIWKKDETTIHIIDQRSLPHQLTIESLTTVQDCATAIRDMHVRGAPLIGATAAYGMYLATREAAKSENFKASLQVLAAQLKATRPTAVNLAYAVNRVLKAIKATTDFNKKSHIALQTARDITEESVEHCRQIGEYGLELIKTCSQQKASETVHILTHCNAGWMACVDYGTATAPIYAAHDAGLDIHVWVDETRPRNQGARITAYELGQHGVPHTVIADNTGGHLMQHGMVDMVIVGSDRTTLTGDVANKIGTYLKALAANDNNVPFYVALPSSSFDFGIKNGLTDIPIEERGAEEVSHIQGWIDGELKTVLLTPADSPSANYAFDVTPARLVSGLITERGICAAEEKAISTMFSDLI